MDVDSSSFPDGSPLDAGNGCSAGGVQDADASGTLTIIKTLRRPRFTQHVAAAGTSPLSTALWTACLVAAFNAANCVAVMLGVLGVFFLGIV
jgi:hypothetical protein